MSARDVVSGAAGSAGGAGVASTLYVDDVFSTYLYTGTGGSQTVNNGIDLTGSPTNSTVLHMTGDAVYDYAPNSNALTSFGNVSSSTAVKKYGTGSLSFDGSGDYITSQNNSQLNVGNNDFTLEFWMYVNVLPTNWKRVFSIMNPAIAVAADEGLIIEISNTNKLAAVFTSGSTAYNITDPTTLTATTWTHWAMVKLGTTMTLYRNGTSVGTVSIPLNTSVNFSSLFQLYLGRWPGDTARDFNGYIDDLRLIKGVAVYTANFTPPSAALPLDTLSSGGGMIWCKPRTSTSVHVVVDTVNGGNKYLSTNSSAVMNPGNDNNNTMVFTNTGFVSNASYGLNWSTSGANFATWTFKKAAKFFDIVTYTGDGTSNRNVTHSLGVKPGFVIIKRTDSVTWGDWHVSARCSDLNYAMGASGTFGLNLTGVASGTNANPSFTSTTVNVDNVTSTNGVCNVSGASYVMYLFAHDSSPTGLIQCGSYTGNGSATGPVVNLGWEVQFVLIKNVTSVNSWYMFDVMRGMPVFGSTAVILANLSDSETLSSSAAYPNGFVQPTANGFIPMGNSLAHNGSANTYIYIAIRRPNKPPTSGTQVFSASTANQIRSANSWTSISGFSTDLLLSKIYNATDATWLTHRATRTSLRVPGTSVEDTGSYFKYDVQNGISGGATTLTTSTYIWVDMHFKRAPTFFDIVCQVSGNSETTRYNHNLGVVPELIVWKSRGSTTNGALPIWHSSFARNNYMFLNDNSAKSVGVVDKNWGTSNPTAYDFGINDSNTGFGGGSWSGPAIAYLFATCPGVSKVGGYTGNGGALTVSCGFAAGSRFIMIKRVDAIGDWYIWNSATGITASNDTHISLNSSSPQVTTDDSIDPDNSGFIVNQVAATNINVTSATYIFLAIA